MVMMHKRIYSVVSLGEKQYAVSISNSNWKLVLWMETVLRWLCDSVDQQILIGCLCWDCSWDIVCWITETYFLSSRLKSSGLRLILVSRYFPSYHLNLSWFLDIFYPQFISIPDSWKARKLCSLALIKDIP